MKEGWRTRSLADVCHFANGLWKGEKPPFVTVGVIRNTNFNKEGFLDDADIAYIDVEARKLETRRLEFGDIILEKSGGGPKQPVGRVALFDKSDGVFSFSNFTAAIRVRDVEELDFRFLRKFLHWTYLSGVTEGIQSHSTGIRNLNGDAYKAIEISYPPLPEQQRIVALLEEAFAGLATAKANVERNLQHARAVFESYLESVFSQRGESWTEQRLGDLSRINYGYTESASDEKVGPHFLRITDIQENGVDWDSVPYCRIDAKAIPKYKLIDGDIVFARTGASTGKSYLVTNPPESVFASYLIRLQLSRKELLPQFLNLYFQSPLYWAAVRAGVSGSAQGGFNASKLGELVIPYPKSSEEQLSVVDHLNELAKETQHLTHLYERKLAALEELKKSLLQQAFNGEL